MFNTRYYSFASSSQWRAAQGEHGCDSEHGSDGDGCNDCDGGGDVDLVSVRILNLYHKSMGLVVCNQ